MLSSADIRRAFLAFFGDRGHEIVPSSPLVPANDPTLLFTNAGMVQFKEAFQGLARRANPRAVSAQRCVRAGGKHNDLDNVGYTARHHTFFEMLGNFSFGDYFKREAIAFAWALLTEEFRLPAERLWVTVYETDDEAARIWTDVIGVDPARLTRCGAADNFWSMGDTGPCGPCTEIFYDHGPEVAGGPPGTPEADGDRYVEIWNLVFMQFDRDARGEMTPIPAPSVDTGMGLERIAAVLQGVRSNYETDVFRGLIEAVAAMVPGERRSEAASMRVIADHIRSVAFLILDGVLPANDGRGYVLRRIIRRAVRHGHKLGLDRPFFSELVPALGRGMGDAHPALRERAGEVAGVIHAEESRFLETLDQGLRQLEHCLARTVGGVLSGADAFQLYDTFGFPLDLTADVVRERGLTVDLPAFERAMEAQRERGRAAHHFAADVPHLEAAAALAPTGFRGYAEEQLRTRVAALFVDGRRVQRLEAGTEGAVVLEQTPFYAESGGQVGDRGMLVGANGSFEVQDTQKQGAIHVHLGRLRLGALGEGEEVEARIDAARRDATRAHHSATHLLHAALRRVLGPHVQQKGSLVGPDRLRFDFAHGAPVGRDELREIERLVNAEVRANRAVETETMALESAVQSGAVALFGEKYDAEVRVLSMGAFSRELCGGTHVTRTGDIGLLLIVSESGVAAGVRRVEAVAGSAASEWLDRLRDDVQRLADLLKVPREQLTDRVERTVERVRSLERDLAEAKRLLARERGSDLGSDPVDLGACRLVTAVLEEADAETLRETADRLRDKLAPGVVVLAGIEPPGRVRLVATVSSDLTKTVAAGELVAFVARQVGGKGGGRADFAQAGGTDAAAVPAALASVEHWLRERLGA